MSGVYSVWGPGAANPAVLHANVNDQAIRRHLAALAIANSEGFNGARREIGEFFVGEVQDNLDGQKLFDGTPMKQSKAAKDRVGKTLIHHHHLYDSYVYQLNRGGVEIGSALVYAAIHHFGGQTGRKHKTKIDARPVLGATDRHEKRVGDILIAEIGKMQ